MIEAVIIEDEERARRSLKALLAMHCADQLRIVGEADSVTEAVTLINTLKPELVFMDISLKGGTGFDVLNRLDNSFDLIFITAFDSYALRAFKFSALDYLLKPIDPDELVLAIQKISRKHKAAKDKQLSVLREMIEDRGKKTERLVVPVADGLEIIHLNTIIYCQADRNYTNIVMTDGTRLVSSKTLKYYEELLMNHDFMRVHNSYIANLSQIKKFHKQDDGVLEMSNGERIDVARSRKAALLEAIMNLS